MKHFNKTVFLVTISYWMVFRYVGFLFPLLAMVFKHSLIPIILALYFPYLNNNKRLFMCSINILSESYDILRSFHYYPMTIKFINDIKVFMLDGDNIYEHKFFNLFNVNQFIIMYIIGLCVVWFFRPYFFYKLFKWKKIYERFGIG